MNTTNSTSCKYFNICKELSLSNEEYISRIGLVTILNFFVKENYLEELSSTYTMTSKELKQKAEEGDSIACYELGLTYKGKNYNNMLKWLHESAKKGYRYLEILGGVWKNIVGGWGPDHPNDKPAFIFRMKGGHILGSIYGAAQYEAAKGTCTFVITGGTVNGWIAGGANGTNSTKGDLDGESFIYVGGAAQINSGGSTDRINRAVGGNVFGAGCGY